MVPRVAGVPGAGQLDFECRAGNADGWIRRPTLEFPRWPIVQVDAIDEELHVVGEIVLRAEVPAAEATLVEVERSFGWCRH